MSVPSTVRCRRLAHSPAGLFELSRRAIAAGTLLTAASLPGAAVDDALYAALEQAADDSRRDLLQCLDRDHGIDPRMASQLGALL